jgi:hypothetical protein
VPKTSSFSGKLVASLIRRHQVTGCSQALGRLIQVVLAHDGNEADEGHAYLYLRLGLVVTGSAAGPRNLVLLG